MSAIVKQIRSARTVSPHVRAAFFAKVYETHGLTFPDSAELTYFEECDEVLKLTPYEDDDAGGLWVILRETPYVRGWYGHYSRDDGLKKHYFEFGDKPVLSNAQSEELNRQRDEDRKRLNADRVREESAWRAKLTQRWESAPPIPPDFRYLVDKGITGVLPADWKLVQHRFTRKRKNAEGKEEEYRAPPERAMMVPRRTVADSSIVTFEFFAEDGKKQFAGGLRAPKGAVYLFGTAQDGQPIFIGEGVATAWTVHRFSGCIAYSAGSAQMLKTIGKQVREHYGQSARVVLLPERSKDGTRGNAHALAIEAARVIAASICEPPFDDNDDGATDFNDFRRNHGDEETRAALQDIVPVPDDPQIGTVDAAQREWVERINEEGYFVARWGNETTICRENEDGSVSRESDRSFHLALENRPAPGTNVPSYRVWRRSRHRRQKDRVAYDPEWQFLDRDRDCNLWRGFGVKPAPGKCDLWKRHLEVAVAGGNKAIFDYIWNWLASAVQHPGRPAGVALVLTGDEGTGKGTVFNPILKIYGRHGLMMNKTEQLAGRFSSHLEGVSFIFGDEIGWAKDRALRHALYNYVTEPQILVEPKGHPQYSIRNTLTFGLATNADHAAQISRDSRRFFIVKVQDLFGHLTGEAKKRERKKYFDTLYRELQDGGYEALLYELQNTDISNFDPQVFPVTDAHRDNVERSLEAEERWLVSALRNGTPYVALTTYDTLGELNVWPDKKSLQVPKRSLFEDCQRFCRQEGMRYPVSEQTFWKSIKKVFGPHLEETHKNTGTARVRHVSLPSLGEARTIVAEALGIAPIEDPLEDSMEDA
jgi:hypothetical protein